MKPSSPEMDRLGHGPEARVTGGVLVNAVIALCMGIAFTLPFLITCGPSLALFLAGCFILTITLPPIVLIHQRAAHQLILAACIVDGIAVVWLFAVTQPQIEIMHWLTCYVVLVAYATLLVGISTALGRLRLPPLAASAITVILSLAWLTWPIWLSPSLTGPGAGAIVAALVKVHPLFAINGVLSHLGAWSHWPIAYQHLTNLGQDIPYTLPTSIWAAACVHLLPGALLCLIAMRWKRSCPAVASA